MEPNALTILYFGSFNPPHRGHVAVADQVLDRFPAARLWWVVSPQNPLKSAEELAPAQNRLEMVSLALNSARHRGRIEICTVEFELPRPSLTIRTLEALSERFPERRFSLLIGSDNVAGFNRWVRHEEILARYPVLVYPREGYEPPWDKTAQHFTFLEGVPLMPQAATDIRELIARGDNSRGELPEGIWHYIQTHGLYGYPEPDLKTLDRALETSPDEVALLLQRGKLHHREGRFDQAYNDFVRVLALDPGNAEAQGYLSLLKEIFAFRYTDLYNP